MIKLVKSAFFKEKQTRKKLVDFIVKADTLSMGRECFKFEKAFAKRQGRKRGVFVNSGSSANLLLLQSLYNLGCLKKGDPVGFSALTWPTNVMPMIQLGFLPVAIDCEINTLNISPNTLQKKVKKIKALFLTNVLGLSDDIEEIADICRKNKIILLEDNCEALGSKVGGRMLGNFGLASTFSFYVGHHLSTIEGGMISTDNYVLDAMLRMSRAHGWDRSLALKEASLLRRKNKVDEFFDKYTFYDLAYNFRPTEIQGFLGNEQLKYWDIIVSKRQKNFLLINEVVKKNKDLIPIKSIYLDVVSNFSFPVICKEEKKFKIYRNRFNKAKVEIRPIIAGNMARQPFYKKYVQQKDFCPNADFIHRQAFYFGNNPDITKEEINLFCKLLSPI